MCIWNLGGTCILESYTVGWFVSKSLWNKFLAQKFWQIAMEIGVYNRLFQLFFTANSYVPVNMCVCVPACACVYVCVSSFMPHTVNRLSKQVRVRHLVTIFVFYAAVFLLVKRINNSFQLFMLKNCWFDSFFFKSSHLAPENCTCLTSFMKRNMSSIEYKMGNQINVD